MPLGTCFYRRCGLATLCFSLFIGVFSSASSAAITETTLLNGLKVIIKEDHRSPMVMSQIWYKVGSADETENILGISHVLEHMMFKGTSKVPNDEFTRLSRQFGGRVNASTFTNYTNYYQLYPKAYFPLALELEADRMSNLLMRQKDLEPEVRVVMEERRQRTDDNPRALALEQFKLLSYPNSAYRQPIIGHMRTLQNIRLKDLQDWYKTWYRPNNAILVIVGDVKSSEAVAQVQRYFGDIPSQALPTRPSVTEPKTLARRHLDLSMSVQTSNLYMAWNVPSLNTAQTPEDAFSLNILRNILNSGISSRLQSRLIREQHILTAVSVSYDPYNRGDTLFSISAVPHAGISLEDAEKAIQAEIDQLKKQPIAQSELDRFSTRYVANMVYNQDDIIDQAQLIGTLEVNGISHRIIPTLAQRYQQIHPSDLQRVAHKYFKNHQLSTLYLSPEQKAP